VRSPTSPTPPAWLLAAKALLAALLVVGAAFPDVGGFAGKGMLFRLPFFLAPSLVVPLLWWRGGGRRPYDTALDLALTLPFLVDTAANAVGLYDHVDATDDVLHLGNWVLLVGGITASLLARPAAASSARAVVWMAGTGLGAVLIIGWEVAEYAVMQAGVGGLSLTYGDTLGDLVLSTSGGAIGAAIALRRARPAPTPAVPGDRVAPDRPLPAPDPLTT
jgi:hypothetical protein